MAVVDALRISRPIILPFLVLLTLYSLAGTALIIWLGKEETHLFLNAGHNIWLDLAFKNITHIGHGAVPLLLFLLLLFVRYSWALGLGVSSLLMGISVQFLKRSVFAGDHRPALFFEDGQLPSIDGVDLMLHHSFPSGHSATAFCVCLMLALFIKQHWASWFFATLALAIAFSRVYISQHFIEDTIVGSWIGLVMAMVGYAFIVFPAEMNPDARLNRRLWPS